MLGVYKSDTKTITNGSYSTNNTLVCTFNKKKYKFNFKENICEVISNNYKVTVSIEDDNIDFSIFSDYFKIEFGVDAETTYLGVDFSYENGNSYIDGTVYRFVKDDNIITYEGFVIAFGDSEVLIY
ncbi:hypothetical protein J6Y73_04470 [bacterium]|nr:hypothetical protein [bacterium]